MAFFYIDETDNFKLKADTTSMLFVPEFKDLVERKGYGWNFLYYTFLFVSRAPFGRLPEEIRDQRISEIVESFPYVTSSPKNVQGFYKQKLFKPVAEKLKELYPDLKYDTYLSSANSLDKFRRLRDSIEVDPKKIKKSDDGDNEMERNFALFEAYGDQMDKLLKQMNALENDMRASLSQKSENLGMGSMKKQMQKTQ